MGMRYVLFIFRMTLRAFLLLVIVVVDAMSISGGTFNGRSPQRVFLRLRTRLNRYVGAACATTSTASLQQHYAIKHSAQIPFTHTNASSGAIVDLLCVALCAFVFALRWAFIETRVHLVLHFIIHARAFNVLH